MKIESELKETRIGKLPIEWRIEKLKNVTTEIFTGSTPPLKVRKYIDNGTNFIRSQNIFDHYIDFDKIIKLNEQSLPYIKRCELKMGDVLLNITGDGITFLRCCKVMEELLPAYVSQSISVIRTKQELDNDFLALFLSQNRIKKYMEGFNAGSARRTLAAKHIKEFLIPLPPLEEQKEISKIFKLINSKLHINRQMNDILENIGQNLYKSYFKEFFPFKNKPFKDSKLGKIPKDWKVISLGDIVNHQKGFGFKSKWYKTDGIPIVKVRNFTKNSINLSNCDYLDKIQSKNFEKYVLKLDDVIIATVGSWPNNPDSIVGKVIRVPYEAVGALLNQNAVRLRVKNSSFSISSLYYLLKRKHFSNYLVSGAQGSANQASITLKHIFNYKILYPPEEVIVQFNQKIVSIVKKMQYNLRENNVLMKIEALLLPQLISGRIRLNETILMKEE